MQTPTFRNLLKLGIIASAVRLALQARAEMRLPTGQFITPTAMRGAVQQPLNPGLAAYPDFVAGAFS